MKKSLLPAALVFVACSSFAVAQGWQSQTVPPPSGKPKVAVPQSTPQHVASSPSGPSNGQAMQVQVQYLVRTSLIALNDANRSGNYTVLRDIAAPSFREKNSAADLAHIFAEMRRARLDLSMAAILAPEFDEQPSLDGERRLRLKGHFATEPNRVVFDLIYEPVGGHWLLNGISISTKPSRSAAGGPAPVTK
jgi:hypothetical protein